jgi:ectoine hydroxylase
MSPLDRKIVLVTYNRVDNAPRHREQARPEFLVSRDFTPVAPLAGDALLA